MEAAPKATGAAAITDFLWAREYHPWRLLIEACLAMGARAAILIFVYLQICPWNPKWHLVAMYCSPETIGPVLAYPCEGTKAFVRSFPLLAASLSLITVERFIVQRRLYFHLLAKRALMDYTNYHPGSDKGFIIVVFCFTCSMLHFAMDFALPPYNYTWATFDKIQDIGNIYVMPCGFFIVLFHKFLDIEKHLVPLAKFYDEDPDWAKAHLADSELYSDLVIREQATEARQKLCEERGPEGTYTLDELIHETLEISETHGQNVVRRGSREAVEEDRRKLSDLFAGLWPSEILLDPRLTDEDSVTFRRAFRVFRIGFFAVQLTVLYLLVGNAWQEALDVIYTAVPAWEETLVSDGHEYSKVGDGYCRDESMHRPDGFFQSQGAMDIEQRPEMISMIGRAARLRAGARRERLPNLPNWMNPLKSEKIEDFKHACALHCSHDGNCIAFTQDEFFCSIYIREAAAAPPGWTEFSESKARTSSARRLATVVQANGSPDAQCWKKLQKGGDPQDIAGFVVYIAHIALIMWIIVQSARKY